MFDFGIVLFLLFSVFYTAKKYPEFSPAVLAMLAMYIILYLLSFYIEKV